LNPFGDKIFAVQTVHALSLATTRAHIISTQALKPVNCFSYKARGNLQALFSFFDNTMLSRFAQKAARMPPKKANRRQSLEVPTGHQAVIGLK